MGAVCFSTAFSASALSLALTMVLLWKSWALTFLLASKVSMTSWYFHPTSWLNRPNEQNFLHGLLSPLGLVWHHSPDRAPKDLGRRAEMEGSSGRLDVATQPQKLQVLELVPVEVTAHVDTLASHDDDLVAQQNVLGDDGGQTAHQVAAAINHHRLRRKSRHCWC